MKKLIMFFVFIFAITSHTYAYDLTDKDRQNLQNFEKIVYNIFDNTPQKAFVLEYRAKLLLQSLDQDTKNYALIENVIKITSKYISTYLVNSDDSEQENQSEEDDKDDDYHEQSNGSSSSNNNQDGNEQDIEKDDNDESSDNLYGRPTYKQSVSNLEILWGWDYKTMSSFTLEPSRDGLYLKNIYMQNIWSLQHMWPIIEELYLVDDNNKILSNWYVIDDYIYFDIFAEIFMERDTLYNLDVVAKLWQADNKMETGEIIFDFSAPSDALQGTSNGIRAISYSNWGYIASNAQINDKIKTFVSYNSWFVSSLDFAPWYRQAAKFRVNNFSDEKLELKSFKFRISGSFMNYVNNDSKFTLWVDGSSREFGSWLVGDIVDWYLVITKTWDAYDFISQNSYTDYVLEIDNKGTTDWSREVRLENIVVWDGFGGTIDNLNDYSNTWLPMDEFYYRY